MKEAMARRSHTPAIVIAHWIVVILAATFMPWFREEPSNQTLTGWETGAVWAGAPLVLGVSTLVLVSRRRHLPVWAPAVTSIVGLAVVVVKLNAGVGDNIRDPDLSSFGRAGSVNADFGLYIAGVGALSVFIAAVASARGGTLEHSASAALASPTLMQTPVGPGNPLVEVAPMEEARPRSRGDWDAPDAAERVDVVTEQTDQLERTRETGITDQDIGGMARAADSSTPVDNLSPHDIARPRYRRPRFLVPIAALVVIAVVAVIAALGGDGDGGASLGSIETPDGSITIDKVEVGERLPPGCGSSDFGCLVAGSGRKLVKVSLDVSRYCGECVLVRGG